MSVSKYFLLSFLIFTFIFPNIAEKKHRPLPLAELQNPKSPSYVPIPYPQTREEILVDLEYVIKKYPSQVVDDVNDVYYVLEKITKTNIFTKKEDGT